MLCGGSDAAIIPIGIVCLRFIIIIIFGHIGLRLLISVISMGAGLGGFVACRALSQRNSDPAKASRPWDIVISNIPFGFISGSLLQ